MKKRSLLKKTRVAVSLLILTLLSFYFLDFAGLLPDRFHLLAKLQFIPALLALNGAIIICLVLLTLLFGRIYCSSLCPLGTFQDIVGWLSKKWQRKKKFRFLPEQRILRWSVLAIVMISWLAGFSILVALLDPYSAYGRVTVSILKPVYLAINNFIAHVANRFDNYRFYKVDLFLPAIAVLVTAGTTMLVVGFLSYKFGRLYCNSICPVGTVLGLAAKFSAFRVRINEDRCNHCGLCAMKCKASCIDAEHLTIDGSRCVNCFNCLEACHRGALSYGLPVFHVKESPLANKANKNSGRLSRRAWISVSALASMAGIQKAMGRDPDSTKKKLEEIYTSHNVPFRRKHPITPPGSGNLAHFNNHCTACNLCVSKCPSNVLQPTFSAYGLAGILQPAMTFVHGYCNYHCTACTDICPTLALKPITEEVKKTLQVGLVHFVKENCVVVTDGTDCGACSEHCPTQAVSMQPYKDGLRIPVIDKDLCIGCGGCEYICPVRPYRAIYVDGKPVHGKAKPPKEEEQKKIEIEDFGF